MVKRPGFRIAFAVTLLLMTCGAAFGQPASATAQYYTTYQPFGDGVSIEWTTCGSNQANGGCYSGGTLTPFGHACSMLQGTPHVSGSTTRTELYVLDSGATADATAALVLFTKTDIVSSQAISTTITLTKSVPLPLRGGPTAACFMAANRTYIFAGTSTADNAIQVSRAALAGPSPGVLIIGGGGSTIPVSQITADLAGYVSVTFSAGSVSYFYLYGPDGSLVELGGGATFVPNAVDGVSLN